MKKAIRLFHWLFYYGFSKWLPASYLPGCNIFKTIRYFNCKNLFSYCGKNVTIERGANFRSGNDISIGDNSGIGEKARLSGKVTIGNNVMMGPNVICWTRNHTCSRTDIPMSNQGFEDIKPIVIGNDVWIGCNVVLYPGVKVGNGAIIKYAAVVTQDVPDWAIVIGNPAQIIGYRKT